MSKCLLYFNSGKGLFVPLHFYNTGVVIAKFCITDVEPEKDLANTRLFRETYPTDDTLGG